MVIAQVAQDFWSHPLVVGLVVATFTLVGGAIVGGLVKLIRDVAEVKVSMASMAAQADGHHEDITEAKASAKAAHRRADALEHRIHELELWIGRNPEVRAEG